MKARFSERLKELRKEYKLTQKQLALKLGVGQSAIANYEQSLRFPDEKMLRRVADYFSISLDFLMGRTDVHTDLTTALEAENFSLEMLRELYISSLSEGKKREAGEVILSAASCGVDIRDIYIQVLEHALKQVGRDWETGKIDIAEEHYFTTATIQIMSQLYQFTRPAGKRGTVFVGITAPGEQHDIGMRMIADLLELDGWLAYNLGVDLPLRNLISALKLFKADLLGLSATLERNVNNIRSVIESVKTNRDLEHVKIVVGGYPFIQDELLWKKVGADGFARNGIDVVDVAGRLVPPGLSVPAHIGES